MSRFLITIFTILISGFAVGQIEKKVRLDGKEETYTLNFDDPLKLNKWNVSFSGMVVVVEQLDVGIFLDADFKINNKLRLSAMISKSVRTNTSSNFTLNKHKVFEVFPKLHYRYFSRSPLKETKLILSQQGSAYHYIHTNVARNYALDLDGGLNFLNHYNPSFFSPDTTGTYENELADGTYYLASTNAIALTVGTSLTISQHTNYVNCDGYLANKMFIHRLYVLGSLSGNILNQFARRGPDKEISFYFGEERFQRRYLPVGFRVGYQLQNSILLRSDFYSFLGFEIGVNASHKYKIYTDNVMLGESFYLNFRFGIGFAKLAN